MGNHFEESLLYYILAFHLIENAIEIYITSRQIEVFKHYPRVPQDLRDSMSDETFIKARDYSLDKAYFSVAKGIVMSVVVVSLEILLGFIPYIWHCSKSVTAFCGLNPDNEMIVSIAFLLLMSIISAAKELPFTYYSTFVVEEKHGFNKQTRSFFAIDQLKSFAVGNALTIPICCIVIWIIKQDFPYLFVWLWAFTGVVTLVMLTLYPIYIAPLFDTYTPLEEGELRTAIEELARSLNFPLTQLYVVDGSKRSAHSNAYFYGLWRSKRIVLFDTLLVNKGKPVNPYSVFNDNKGCQNSEVLAVLAHELGHWKLGHVTKNIIIMQVHLFLMFAAFGYLFNHDPLYQAFGFPEGEKPVLIGMIIIFSYILAAYNAVISFGMTALSRRFEYQADAFAKELGYAKELMKALKKLSVDNLGFPVYDWLYSTWNHSHPTTLQRLARLKDPVKEDKED